jgi:hypothetical protein
MNNKIRALIKKGKTDEEIINIMANDYITDLENISEQWIHFAIPYATIDNIKSTMLYMDALISFKGYTIINKKILNVDTVKDDYETINGEYVPVVKIQFNLENDYSKEIIVKNIKMYPSNKNKDMEIDQKDIDDIPLSIAL